MSLRRSTSFTLSPKKRQSLGDFNSVTPLTRRQSFSTPPANGLLSGAQNNDEAERRARQISRLQNLQSRSGSSPNASNDRRKSLNSFGGLTHQQLVDHYSKCIQLSTENKINIKNAFNLQLIDYMTEMLKRKDSDMNNFQVASCTLDASTKIYAYRVDSVHTDTLKMAGGLGRTKDKPGGGDGTEEGPQGDEALRLNKKKRKGKRFTPIEANIKNINVAHFDLEFDVDPLFKRMASQFNEGRSGGNSFLNTLQMLDDNCQLVLDSETVLMPTSLPPSQSESQICSIPPLPETERVISKTFEDFEFRNWELSDEDPFAEADKGDKTSTNLPENNDHAFDMNAIPEPLDEMDNYDQAADVFDLAEDGNDGTLSTVGGACLHAGPRPPPPQLEIRYLTDHLANAPLEYSYFDSSRMSAWAGPGHWKLKPLVKNANKQEKSKETRRKDFTLSYDKKTEVDSHFEVLRRSTKLTLNTIKKWKSSTLPIDHHYKPGTFFRFYLQKKGIIRKSLDRPTEDVDVEVYNYDNKNDQENYCPELDGNADGNYDDETPMFDDATMLSQTFAPSSQPMFEDATGADEQTKDFLGDNLVEAPNKVAKINIGYAKTAKKMDMRKLKTSMWQMLSDPNADKENRATNNDTMAANTLLKEEMETDHKIDFSSLYVELLPSLPPKMSENLSVPLAFIALLHLANEHNLRLDSHSPLADFIISQG